MFGSANLPVYVEVRVRRAVVPAALPRYCPDFLKSDCPEFHCPDFYCPDYEYDLEFITFKLWARPGPDPGQGRGSAAPVMGCPARRTLPLIMNFNLSKSPMEKVLTVRVTWGHLRSFKNMK